jgi:hypothetical protein
LTKSSGGEFYLRDEARLSDADADAPADVPSRDTPGGIMSRYLACAAAATLVLACADRSPDPTAPFSVSVYDQRASASDKANFGTPLSAEEEVMPEGVENNSNAVGNAIFHLSADGTELSYKLIVANIENAFMAHIHRAPAGVNGGIVVWLYPSTAAVPVPLPVPDPRLEGVIAEGTITAANLVGSLAGQPLSALIAVLRDGNGYVNVHTSDGVAPANTGPGDFPGGEVRGQVEPRGGNKQ